MIQDKIKHIKWWRLKPEERFLLEILDGIEIHEQTKKLTSVFWKKNNVILFEQDFKNGYLWCNRKLIWSVFTDKYGYNYTDTKSLIKSWVDKDTKLGGLTPPAIDWKFSIVVDKDTKLGGLTPHRRPIFKHNWVDKDTKLGGLTPTTDLESNDF